MAVIIVGRVTYVCPFCHLPANKIAAEAYETSHGVRLCLAFRHYPYGRMCITHWDKASYEAYPWKAWPITEIPSHAMQAGQNEDVNILVLSIE